MRIRATVAAVSGALALTALAVPASQAAQTHDDRPALKLPTASWAQGASGAPKADNRSARAAQAAPVISKTVVNGGKPIVVGTTVAKKVSVSITASDDSGIEDAFALIWTGGSDINDENSYGFVPEEEAATCKAASATTSTCTLTFVIDPLLLWNTDAKTWKVYSAALSKDVEVVEKQSAATVKFQRLSRLTVNAAPEPVKKGKTITVTGKLDRANWDTNKYAGYASQPVKLQFRKKNSNTYTTVKTVKGTNTGALKTTVKAAQDGYWRWSFAGTATTPAVNATGDFVDVK
ncbi:DUF5707 domain-containing protein [Streptomyces sp. NPDC088400]|uniref:DUF5707 domain-containing protein n=1 Tax=Streptomyces sp. NPDC088400 TaxID=3365861 RepID=UPI00380F115A